MKTIAVCLAAIALASYLVATVSAGDEYLDLVARGNDMASAICTGDTVRVKICTNGSLIKTGSQTSEGPGDIIVYCAAAAMPQPPSMFMCGRAISKRFEDGHWYFKTKMDNNTEADAWEVPEYDLLGVVVEVIHNANGNPSTSETGPQNGQVTSEIDMGLPDMFTLVEFAVGIALGLILGFTAKKMLSRTKLKTRRVPSKLSTKVDHLKRTISALNTRREGWN